MRVKKIDLFNLFFLRIIYKSLTKAVPAVGAKRDLAVIAHQRAPVNTLDVDGFVTRVPIRVQTVRRDGKRDVLAREEGWGRALFGFEVPNVHKDVFVRVEAANKAVHVLVVEEFYLACEPLCGLFDRRSSNWRYRGLNGDIGLLH